MFKTFATGILISLTFASCATKEDSKNLAEIGSYSLTEEHFEGAFKKFYHQTGQAMPINSTSKKSIFENEFYPMVLAYKAEQEGLNETEEAQRFYSNAQKSILVNEYINKFVLDTVSVTDRQVRDFFKRTKTYWRASHLFADSKEKADSLRLLLEKGKDFDELAKGVFNNPNLASTGGDLGLFTADEMDLAFEDTVATMKEGDISQPVKTSYGYSIIRLDKYIPEPIITESSFINVRHQIEQIELKRQKHRVSDAFIVSTIQELAIDQQVLDKLTEALWKNNSFALEDLKEFQVEGLGRTLDIVGSDNFSFSVGDVLEEIEQSPDEQIVMINTKNKLRESINAVVFRSYLISKALKNNLDNNYRLQETLKYRYYNFLASEVEKNILDTVSVAFSEIDKDYTLNSDIYVEPSKLHLLRIVVANKESAEKIYQKLTVGHADFIEMASKYSILGEDRLVNADMGYVSLKELGTIGQKLNKVDVGAVSEPIEYSTNRIHIYKVLDKTEPRTKTLSESEEEIRDRIKNRKLKQARKKLVNEILQENGIEIDWDKISNIKVNV